MTEKKVLIIHLTDEWYQKIANGEKTEEYRECSLYWTVRLLRKDVPNRPDVIAGVAPNIIVLPIEAFSYKATSPEVSSILRIVRKIELTARRY